MAFCPFPHAARDQLWLSVGVGVGAAVCYLYCSRSTIGPTSRDKPRTLAPQAPVVKTESIEIRELVGNATNGDSGVSIAHVTVDRACEEATQTPKFDEYVYVEKGTMVAYVGASDVAQRPAARRFDEPFVLEAKAGETLWLPKGHRYRYTFPGACQYVAVCFPAFRPDISGRE